MERILHYDMSDLRGPLANAFLVLINALFFNIRLIGLPDVYPSDSSNCLAKEGEHAFDFVIVGAGAAGCAIANGLTESEKWSVLLVEAGDYPSATAEVPNLNVGLKGTSEDWHFMLEKDDHACKSYYTARCFVSRGKCLGGSSATGDLIYTRGLTEDYDRQTFDSWGSETAYKIFERMENYKGPDVFNIKYGREGLIKLEYTNYTGPPKEFLKQVYKEVGLLSLSHRHALGYTDFLKMMAAGEKKNMAKSFLTPIKHRPNFFFSKDTEVTHVTTTEMVDSRATGVEAKIRGKDIFIRARKEVILTAGPFNNAKILLLSGLGPRDYLKKKKIPCKVNLPGVGKNLQLHLTLPVYVSYKPASGERDYYDDIAVIKETYDYIIHRTGGLSHTNINEFITFISTNKSDITLPNLGIRHHYFRIEDRRLKTLVDAFQYHPRIRSSLFKKNKDRAIIMFSLVLVKPLSTGEVFLNDSVPLGNPKIVPKFLSDAEDVDYNTLASGFKFIANITATFKEELEMIDVDIPNCRSYRFCTLNYLRCYIYNMATPNRDVAGTTAMGADCEQNAVVKENLQVRSMRCLRVADISVMNKIMVGNNQATSAMIGFKMAEILKEKWLKNYKSEFTINRPNEPV